MGYVQSHFEAHNEAQSHCAHWVNEEQKGDVFPSFHNDRKHRVQSSEKHITAVVTTGVSQDFMQGKHEHITRHNSSNRPNAILDW